MDNIVGFGLSTCMSTYMYTQKGCFYMQQTVIVLHFYLLKPNIMKSSENRVDYFA